MWVSKPNQNNNKYHFKSTTTKIVLYIGGIFMNYMTQIGEERGLENLSKFEINRWPLNVVHLFGYSVSC
jgi:hypothetical protein